MKTLVLAIASVAALSGAAFANTAATAEIQFYAPNADVSVLSNAEIAQLQNVIHSGDSESEVRNAVRAAFK